MFVLIFITEYIAILLLRAQPIQSCNNGIKLILHQRGYLFECQLVPCRT